MDTTPMDIITSILGGVDHTMDGYLIPDELPYELTELEGVHC